MQTKVGFSRCISTHFCNRFGACDCHWNEVNFWKYNPTMKISCSYELGTCMFSDMTVDALNGACLVHTTVQVTYCLVNIKYMLLNYTELQPVHVKTPATKHWCIPAPRDVRCSYNMFSTLSDKDQMEDVWMKCNWSPVTVMKDTIALNLHQSPFVFHSQFVLHCQYQLIVFCFSVPG